jgi:hypothetical protein
MSDPTYFRIEDGQFGLQIVDTAAVGYDPSWLAPAGKSVTDAVIADYDTKSPSWSCQITEMRMTATASTRTETIEDTICQAGREVANPQKATWAVVLALYQDANYVALQQFADEHDAELAYFFAAFDGVNPPKAVGTLFLAPLPDLGGVARTNLKATATWPVYASQRLYGSATVSEAVPPDEVAATAAADGAAPVSDAA